MNSTTIDTLVIFDRLKKIFTEEQAHTISEIFKDIHEENLKTLATKADLQATAADFKRELKELELRLTLRMGAMLAATIAILAAIIKLA